MTVLLIVLAVLVLAAFFFGLPTARRRGFGRRRGSRLGRGRFSGRWGRRL
jgi:hypothetical protein